MRSELVLAINQLCAERRLPPDVVKEALQAALISAYKRNFGATTAIDVRIDLVTGDVRVYAAKEVVDAAEDPQSQITLADARGIDPLAQLGQTVQVESTPRDFGRIAAQAAKQVILQRIREAEREMLFSTFAGKEGEIASGTVQSIDLHSQDIVVNLDGVEALLPAKEQVPTEKHRRGARIRVYVLEVRKGSRGPQIMLSRRTPLFLRGLFEMEVPEVYNGTVEIKNITREAGSRSKVAVRSTQDGVDPVGSCVGVRGTRIQKVVDELGGEKIDVVQWSADPAVYIGNALSPAKVMSVRLDEVGDTRTATVIVPDRQLSLAIGKEGQNARLAAKLTGWRIDIKSASEVADETLGKLSDRVIPPEEMGLLDLAEAILQKRELTGLTSEEEHLVAAELEKTGEAGLRWPEQEPATAVGAGEPETAALEASLDATAPHAEEQASQPLPQPDGTVEPVDGTAQPELLPSQEEPVSRRVFAREEELLPTFDGEPVEESTGWVQPATQDELYSGWEDAIEEAPEDEAEWDREELEEETPRGGKKRKKKSGKSRFGRGHTRE
ncbi:MAG TPA: transcription termination factor NusA [Anaerolineae bacterium]|nr:transcription termination factor NusA [Anaerolineae bacterium]